jgi:hypothetical protein
MSTLTRTYVGYGALLDGMVEEGWTDGLPVIPATPARIEEYLDVVGLGATDVIGEVPSRDLTVRAHHVAAAAVMAGCRPEYMPAVLAAAQGHLSPLGNAHCVLATLTGALQTVILSGPVRTELGVLCGRGAFGPGSRANATIGRALRLVARNACQSIPADSDRAAFSHPARYSFCFGEDEENTTWNPMHVDRGYAATDSVVTVHSMTDYFALSDHDSDSPEQLLRRFAHLARCRPISRDAFLAENRTVVLVFGPEHRQLLEAAGWAKADVRAFLHPLLTAPHTRPPGRQETQGMSPLGGPTESSHYLPNPDNILIVAAGGPGLHLSWILYPHLASAVSAVIPYDYRS